MLDLDEGARRLGEFAFGNNPNVRNYTKNILFDEKMGGTVHMALGAAYPETGGLNESALHWDMVCDLRQGGEVYVDGVLFAKDGAFVI
jgi:aminopeptidase